MGSYKKRLIKKNKICSYCQKEFNNYINNATTICSDVCRFMQIIAIDQSTNCWICTKKTQKIPLFTINEQSLTIKAASFKLFKKEERNYKFYLRNTCFNIDCANPEHIIENNDENFFINKKCTKCDTSLTMENIVSKKSAKRIFESICIRCKVLSNKEYNNKKGKSRINLTCIICGANTFKRGIPTINTCSVLCKFKSQYSRDEDGCFIWTGILARKSKPRFYISTMNKSIQGQKYAYWLKNQNGYSLEYLQKKTNIAGENYCKKELCVNPDHIFLSNPSLKTAQKQSKLNSDQIKELKRKYEEDTWSGGDLSRHYNLSKPCVYRILNGRTLIQPKTKTSIEIENYDICLNCSKQHDNLGSQYCSTTCMNEWIINEK